MSGSIKEVYINMKKRDPILDFLQSEMTAHQQSAEMLSQDLAKAYRGTIRYDRLCNAWQREENMIDCLAALIAKHRNSTLKGVNDHVEDPVKRYRDPSHDIPAD